MQWYKKLREVEWISSLLGMAWGFCKGAWRQIAAVGGVSMSELMGWIPGWLMTFLVAVAGVSLFTLVESFVKKKTKERNKKEKQQQKSTENLSGGLGGSAVVQVRSAEEERDRYQYREKADEKEKELTELRSYSKAFKQKYGRWFLQWGGSTISPIGLSVAVQFIDLCDSNLAKKIWALFFSIGGTWKRKPVEQVKWQQNPSSESRVVIFSDHEHADGIKDTFNDFCLLDEERVDLYSKDPGMSEDITIIVFNKDN